jgi:hypothetical protein
MTWELRKTTLTSITHSSARIAVECAFGEIKLRGILWRALKCSLPHNIQIIDACMRLHNFIIAYRESTADNQEGLDIFDECRRFLAFNPDESVEVQGGELDDKLDADGNRLVGGRPTTDDAAATLQGKNLRQQLCNLVARHGYVRPATNWFKNRNGLIESYD